jgi:HupE / UreJ protein
VIACAAAALFGAEAVAHPAVSTVAVVKVSPDGALTVRVTHDVLAFALNDTSARVSDPPMYELLNGPRDELKQALGEARDRMGALLRVEVDGTPVAMEILEAPDLAAIDGWRRENPAGRLPVKLDFLLRGRVAQTSAAMTVKLPDILGDAVLSVDRPGVEPIYLPLAPGEISPRLAVFPAGRGAQDAKNFGPEGRPTQERAPELPENPGTWDIAWRYTKLGFTHIIPGGSDHALFVLGLFLLSPRLKSILWQITAFTVAHSITLFLTTFGVIRLSPNIIEPTIAATIAFVAIENLFVTRVHAWRPAVAFLFGLVHGMGFASALREVGLPTGKLVAGVLAFNVGVEGGHLAVLAAAFLALGWWRSTPWYRKRVAIPLSVGIGAIATVWIVQRLSPPPSGAAPEGAAAHRGSSNQP